MLIKILHDIRKKFDDSIFIGMICDSSGMEHKKVNFVMFLKTQECTKIFFCLQLGDTILRDFCCQNIELGSKLCCSTSSNTMYYNAGTYNDVEGNTKTFGYPLAKLLRQNE